MQQGNQRLVEGAIQGTAEEVSSSTENVGNPPTLRTSLSPAHEEVSKSKKANYPARSSCVLVRLVNRL